MGLFDEKNTNTTTSTVVSLKKGETVSLAKKAPALKEARIGLGWDTSDIPGIDFDLDASVFLIDDNDKVQNVNRDFVFYNNLRNSDGSVIHQGDNRTGEGEGDDEAIIIHLDKVSPEVKKIDIVVTIHEAMEHQLNFGQVENAFVRLVDEKENKEILRYDLSNEYSSDISVVFARLIREGNGWSFKAMGDGTTKELSGLCAFYGVNAS